MYPRPTIDSFFNDLFGEIRAVQNMAGQAPAAPIRRLTLATDIVETDDAFVFEADLPGVNADDLEIDVDKNVLKVTATRSTSRADDDGEVHRSERASGVYERRFTLGERLDPENIDATLANGVLTLRVAKAVVQKPRRVVVKTGGGPSSVDTAKNEDAEVNARHVS